MTSSASSQVKRHKPDSEDSPDKLSRLLNKSADMCNHCNKKCTVNDEAIQCDLCSTWVHASCENLSHEQYNSLSQLASSANVVYYCNLNSCSSRVKSIMAEWMQTSSNVAKSLKESHTNLLSELENLHKSLRELSGKLDTLHTSETELQDRIKNTTTALSAVNLPATTQTSPSATAIVDEYLDRKRRKSNLIIYGLPEPTGSTPTERRSYDDANFSSIVNTEFQIDTIEISKSFRLAKRVEGKNRPLLITLMDNNIRNRILRNAKDLQKSSTYSKVFISPDLSPKERASNKILRQELRRRKEAGEANLIIRHGKIVTKPAVPNTAAVSMDSSTNNQQ